MATLDGAAGCAGASIPRSSRAATLHYEPARATRRQLRLWWNACYARVDGKPTATGAGPLNASALRRSARRAAEYLVDNDAGLLMESAT
jgi:hypothetical protein